VEAAGNHTCGLRGGELYCFGLNGNGQLGSGAAGIHDSPQRVVGTWDSVALGDVQTCAISGGALACFGALPLQPNSAYCAPLAIGEDVDWIAASVGYNHACGIRDDNVWC
jgi:hypothetical protein